MTDKAVSALTSLTGANTATGDLLYIVDISEAAAADRSKKITIQESFKGVPAGAEATPSLAAQGDQDTGMWFPAANALALSTGGNERVRINSSGHFGLGVNNPSFRLSALSSDNIIAAFRSQASSYPSGQNYNVIIGRGTNNIPHSTTTTIASGYGGGIAMIAMRQVTGNDTQYTYLVTWAWSTATVLLSNSYGSTSTTSTFTASNGNLQVSHDHTTGDCVFIVGAVINGEV